MNATIPLASLVLITLFAPALSAPTMVVTPVALHAQLDHVMVAIRSLPDGIAEFEQLSGVKAGVGGKHPGRGTENALVSLGNGAYIEIIAPQGNVPLADEYEGMRSLQHLSIFTWAVSVSDVDAAVASLKSAGFAVNPPQPGARVTPSGARLEWSTFTLADKSIRIAPFFIHWKEGTQHPSTTAPGGCSMSAMKLQDPAVGRLSSALKALGVPGVTFVEGPPKIDAIVKCGTKTVALTGP